MIVPILMGFGLLVCPDAMLQALTALGRFLLWAAMIVFVLVAILG